MITVPETIDRGEQFGRKGEKMKEYRIAVVAGDGIGPEVMAECKKVLTAAAELDGGFRFAFTDFPWGCQYYLRTGQMMPEDGIETLRGYDAILLGAVGYPGVPDNISLRDLLIRIRHDFDQYINLRPVKLLRGADCPLKKCEDRGHRHDLHPGKHGGRVFRPGRLALQGTAG